MSNINEELGQLIDVTLKTCTSWLKLGDDNMLRFVDPIDNEEIAAHYGATHAATAFIILGKFKNDDALLEKGKSLITSILNRWDKSKLLPSFHFDFNNFALCIAYDYLIEEHTNAALCEEIKHKVCTTLDSNHNTINWLPMRWYVNTKRYKWTGLQKYTKTAKVCEDTIAQATNKDGGIEDILPKGKSFNLQYDIATLGVLQFMRCRGLNKDLSKEMGFLINSIAPDGDINYQGRGTNQVFAWGVWLYILSSSNQENKLKEAISYLKDKIPQMLDNNNMMLNNFKGEDKYLWWDYHYSSVYIAHFLFWMVLALEDQNKKGIKAKESKEKDTGVSIHKSSTCFIATFSGRKKYLAETGPIISAFWLKKYGMLYKGTFGPWQGHFGNKYTYDDVVLRNYFGLLKIEKNKDWSTNRYINKVTTIKTTNYISLFPIMLNFKIVKEVDGVCIKFSNAKKENVILNFPIFSDVKRMPTLKLLVNGKPMPLQNNTKIRTQYGWSDIYQSKISNEKEWVLEIK